MESALPTLNQLLTDLLQEDGRWAKIKTSRPILLKKY